MKRPAAKPGCFHTCLTGVLKLYGLNNEAPWGNVLAEALPEHEYSRLESRVNSIFLTWASGFSTHVAFLSLRSRSITFHSSFFTLHFSLLLAPCPLPFISIKAEITSSAQS